MLAVLREIQRRFGCALVVVHHAKKGARNIRAGQALRGSSEFHAWVDASLFLRRRGAFLQMSTEHRAHPSLSPMTLRLMVEGQQVALVMAQDTDDNPDSEMSQTPQGVPTRDRVLEALGTIDRPASVQNLQKQCRMRTQTLCAMLAQLEHQKQAIRTARGWFLPADVSTSPGTPAGTDAADSRDSGPAQELFPFPQ